MKKTALVTGGAGFIGSHVADRLVAEDYRVTVIDNLSSGKLHQIPHDAAFYEMDVTSADAGRLVSEGGFDVICHLAAQIDVRKSVADPAFDAQLNIGGSLNLLEAVRRSGRRTRFIFSSTGGAVYGDMVDMPVSETGEKDPQSPYGAAKLSVEYYMGYFARVHGLDTVALRYSNVFGPRQDPHGEAGVVAIFCNRILDGMPLKVFGDGTQTRDYVYVTDVARANVLAASADLNPMTTLDSRAFNVGTAMETTVVELAEILMSVAEMDVPLEFAPRRAGEQLRSSVQIEKSEALLGWYPEMPLRRGLANTLEWFAGQRQGAKE
ncbi:MAG: NAD-dependent epimerase/dehydratase family protein [Gemmatimonadaceae bacterium]